MKTFDIIMYIVAAVCFALAALSYGVKTGTRPVFTVHLVALGLLAWVLVPLVTLIQA